MGLNVTQKIFKTHLVSGKMVPGEEIAVQIDQTLTQDITGTMAYLQYEALGIQRVRTRLSVSYADHNTLQTGFESADDHLYLQSVAAKHGTYFSRAGNGICHQVHLERFSVSGQTLLGADSHTPTCGAVGMIAIGAGGLDVAVAMGGAPFYLAMPSVVLVRLTGTLGPWVSAKDVILELLRRLTVKGGVGKIMEYGGPGLSSLTVPQRATIANMGAELGATTSVFPSDDQTRAFLKAQRRTKAWKRLEADADAQYDDVIELDLNRLEPLVARPHSPDNVARVSEVAGTKIHQVCIGSCTNSSYRDLMTVARVLKGNNIHPDVSFTITPGSRQVLEMIARNGALADIIRAGARVLELACGPCLGMGLAPPSGAVSLRSFNRNFERRSGTVDASVYLASPETCAASAVTGAITDPRDLGAHIKIVMPERFLVDDSMIIPPAPDPDKVEVRRGPNIKPVPRSPALEPTLRGQVLLKLGDNITTDDIMPAGEEHIPLRSNIPALSEHVFDLIDPSFAKRTKQMGGGFVVGGVNYGQGSSREHAALAPMSLGLRAVISKSFARIHKANLINFGILPLVFASEDDYDLIDQGDSLELPEVRDKIARGQDVIVKNTTTGVEINTVLSLSPRETEIILAGGLLNYVVKQG